MGKKPEYEGDISCPHSTEAKHITLRFPERMTAKDVVLHIPAVCAETPISDLIMMIAESKSPHFIVVDDERNLLGIVTESDLLKLISRPSIPAGIGSIVSKDAKFRASATVSDIMTRHPIFVYTNQSLDEVASMMRKYTIGHVAVVDKDKHVVGIVDIKQLLLVLQILK